MSASAAVTAARRRRSHCRESSGSSPTRAAIVGSQPSSPPFSRGKPLSAPSLATTLSTTKTHASIETRPPTGLPSAPVGSEPSATDLTTAAATTTTKKPTAHRGAFGGSGNVAANDGVASMAAGVAPEPDSAALTLQLQEEMDRPEDAKRGRAENDRGSRAHKNRRFGPEDDAGMENVTPTHSNGKMDGTEPKATLESLLCGQKKEVKLVQDRKLVLIKVIMEPFRQHFSDHYLFVIENAVEIIKLFIEIDQDSTAEHESKGKKRWLSPVVAKQMVKLHKHMVADTHMHPHERGTTATAFLAFMGGVEARVLAENRKGLRRKRGRACDPRAETSASDDPGPSAPASSSPNALVGSRSEESDAAELADQAGKLWEELRTKQGGLYGGLGDLQKQLLTSKAVILYFQLKKHLMAEKDEDPKLEELYQAVESEPSRCAFRLLLRLYSQVDLTPPSAVEFLLQWGFKLRSK